MPSEEVTNEMQRTTEENDLKKMVEIFVLDMEVETVAKEAARFDSAHFADGDFIWVLFEAENHLAKIIHVSPDEKYTIEWWYFAYPPLNPLDDEAENAPCLVCKRHPEVFIICDHCNRGGCLPCFGLEAVPDGPWYCGKCKSQQELLGVPDEYWSRVQKNDLILDNNYQPQEIEAACIQDRADVTGYEQRLMFTRPDGRLGRKFHDWIEEIRV